MSISYYLLFSSLCLCSISLHACDARHLSVVHKKFHVSTNKNDDQQANGIDKVPAVLPETKNESTLRSEINGVTRGDSLGGRDHHQFVADINSQKISSSNGDDYDDDDGGEKTTSSSASGTSAAAADQSLVSVSWRLPRSKRGPKNPGFNSDYSPPKTHPPSHN